MTIQAAIVRREITVNGRTYVPGSKITGSARELAKLGDAVEMTASTGVPYRDRQFHLEGAKRA